MSAVAHRISHLALDVNKHILDSIQEMVVLQMSKSSDVAKLSVCYYIRDRAIHENF